MLRRYCDRCRKEIPEFTDPDIYMNIEEQRTLRIVKECKYHISDVKKILGLHDVCYGPKEETRKCIHDSYLDLCEDCRIDLYKVIGEFMDDTPVSSST